MKIPTKAEHFDIPSCRRFASSLQEIHVLAPQMELALSRENSSIESNGWAGKSSPADHLVDTSLAPPRRNSNP